MSRRRRLISERWPRHIAAACCAALFSGAAFASDPEPGKVLAAIGEEVQAIFAKCGKAIAKIEATDHHGRLSGTGFFIDPNGTLFTSYTVGGESRDIVVEVGDRRYPARRVVSDLRSGIAILKIDAETPFLSFGKSRDLSIASPVIAIGYPMDLPLTPAFGTIGGFDLKYMGRYFVTTHIRANVPVQRGEGGAPLLNMKGEVVGILISRLDSGSASFALPIEAAEKVRRDFVRFREVRPGWIGVHVTGREEGVNGSRVLVEEVIQGTPGEKAGFKTGDVVLRVGDREITSPEDLIDASFYLTAEDDVVVRVARGDRQLDLTVQPIDHPDLGRPRVPALGATGDTGSPALQIAP